MNRKDFEKKYNRAIRSFAIANDADMGVAESMLIYEIKCRNGVTERVDSYKGTPDMDYVQAYVDYKSTLEVQKH